MKRLLNAIAGRSMGIMLLSIPILLALGACEELPPEPEGPTPLGSVHRTWIIERLANHPSLNEDLEFDDQVGGVVDVVHELGGVPFIVPGEDSIATAEVFSNETGMTFWIGAEAPIGGGPAFPDDAIGADVILLSAWRFRKDSPDASFQLVISDIRLDAIDHNNVVTPEQCPWGWFALESGACATLIRTRMLARYWVQPEDTIFPTFTVAGSAEIRGFGSDWTPIIASHSPSEALFDSTDFSFDPSPGRFQLRLRSPITVDVPLDSIADGEAFEVGASVAAVVWSRRQGESYVSAFFRDPARTGGLSFVFEGLTMLEPPPEVLEPELVVPPAPPCDASVSPGAGGTIQFETTSYVWPEWPGDEAVVTIVRTGGRSRGKRRVLNKFS